eukprot:gene7681-biopygen11828
MGALPSSSSMVLARPVAGSRCVPEPYLRRRRRAPVQRPWRAFGAPAERAVPGAGSRGEHDLRGAVFKMGQMLRGSAALGG